MRLSLVGELDVAVAPELSRRVRQLVVSGERVRLDLAALDFIDSSGIQELLRAVGTGRERGERLVEVEPRLGRQVNRVIELTGVGRLLWPTDEKTR